MILLWYLCFDYTRIICNNSLRQQLYAKENINSWLDRLNEMNIRSIFNIGDHSFLFGFLFPFMPIWNQLRNISDRITQIIPFYSPSIHSMKQFTQSFRGARYPDITGYIKFQFLQNIFRNIHWNNTMVFLHKYYLHSLIFFQILLLWGVVHSKPTYVTLPSYLNSSPWLRKIKNSSVWLKWRFLPCHQLPSDVVVLF